MFKKAKKLNTILSSLFIVALFGFFACTMHIFPSHHGSTENIDNIAHHHKTNTKKIECVDHNTAFANPNKNDNHVLDYIPTENPYDDLHLTANSEVFSIVNYNNPPPIHKLSIYLKNNVFLI